MVQSAESSPSDPIENPVWTFGDFLLITLGFAGFLLVAAFVAFAIAMGAGRSPDSNLTVLLAVIAQTIAYLATLVMIRRAIRHRSTALHRYLTFLSALRWNPPRRPLLFAGLGVVLATFIILSDKFLPMPQHVPFEEAFKTLSTAYVTSLFGIFVAPLCEEIYFRGLMYPVLVRAFRSVGATLAVAISVTITAILFALLHGDQLGYAWAPLLIIFGVGVILAFVRAHTRSLAASWLVHVSYNTTLLVVIFVQTGAFRHLG